MFSSNSPSEVADLIEARVKACIGLARLSNADMTTDYNERSYSESGQIRLKIRQSIKISAIVYCLKSVVYSMEVSSGVSQSLSWSQVTNYDSFIF